MSVSNIVYLSFTPDPIKGSAFPPFFMMSRTMVDEIGEYCGADKRKIVSIPLSKYLFICPIDFSNSKSIDVLKPRKIKRAFISLQ